MDREGVSGAPGETRTPDPLLRSYAVQNSKCRCWCRLRGSASFISPLNWTEVGPNCLGFICRVFASASRRRMEMSPRSPTGHPNNVSACPSVEDRPRLITAKNDNAGLVARMVVVSDMPSYLLGPCGGLD